MEKTKIEWCDSTWNPVTGCNHGCEYCYARRIAERFRGRGDLREAGTGFWLDKDSFEVSEGSGIYETKYALTTGERPKPFEPYNGNPTPYPFGFSPTLHRYRLGEYEKKAGRTIFVCSMADLFGSWVPDSWIEEVFAACEKAPQHRYLFLTKNPQRYIDLARAGKLPAKDNMWYGTTATTPDEHFFWGGAWHTFVSIEPILRDYSGEIRNMCDTFAQWVIVGAETGNRRGTVVPEASWIKEITKTCIESNITLFMKDSLIPIVGEENMFRGFPWEDKEERKQNIDREQAWIEKYYSEEAKA